MYLNGPMTIINWINFQFRRNKAQEFGGGVGMNNFPVYKNVVDENGSFQNFIFEENEAIKGGGFYSQCEPQERLLEGFSIIGALFKSNQASYSGGAIQIENELCQTEFVINIVESDFQQNKAEMTTPIQGFNAAGGAVSIFSTLRNI